MTDLTVTVNKTIHAPIEEVFDEKTRFDHEGGWGNILDKLNDVMS